MRDAIQLTTLLLAIGTAIRFAEASRRHVMCVRFERELRREADIRGDRG